jgi:type IV pilus assembly protein PilW
MARKLKNSGVTLLELLIAMGICGILVAGIYRLFIAQGRAMAVQDQVVEVQQGVRGAVEILLRDLRMAGFDDDNLNSTVIIADPLVTPVQDDSITVNYEYYDTSIPQYQTHSVRYWRDGEGSRFLRQLTVNGVARPQETLLENVTALSFVYGVDQNADGAMDDRNGNNVIDPGDWVSAAVVNAGFLKPIAVRVALTARPEDVNPDVKEVSPRTLVSAVTLRNRCLLR